MPMTRHNANCDRLRNTDKAWVENTKNAPVKSATIAKTFKFTR